MDHMSVLRGCREFNVGSTNLRRRCAIVGRVNTALHLSVISQFDVEARFRVRGSRVYITKISLPIGAFSVRR